ncbi:hypothetical protein V6N11_032618 [Hibiscus sabdariffa]|uniref:Secreted protein n=1 Tax=Hibiscus sabdariffa TaxID=183260 RepID=A0ABR2T1G5_9ROSI
MMELFVLGCTGVVVFLHGANFFFHVLSQHLAVRSLRFVQFSQNPQIPRILVSWDLLGGRTNKGENRVPKRIHFP